MSSNIKVQRICQHCGKEFTARTTVTQYCSDICSKRAYKARVRAGKVEQSDKETQRIKNQPIEEIKAKEFLTVRDTATLLNISIRSVYYYIENGYIEAVNLGQRITRIKRSALDKLFEKPQPITPQYDNKTDAEKYDLADCYNKEQVKVKYGISESTFRNLMIKNKIPKIQKGKFVYVPKILIDNLFKQ